MARKDISDIQVLRACERQLKGEEARNAIQILNQEIGEPEKVCLRAIERAVNRGLVDYGVSLNHMWATDKGKELLAEEEAKYREILWKALRGEWRGLPKLMEIIGASPQLIKDTMQGLEDKTLSAFAVGMSISKQIHAKLIDLGEISSKKIYNLGTKDQSQAPQQGDIGILPEQTFVFENGQWKKL